MKTTTYAATNADRATQTHRVAVYGSLRQGFGNHPLLDGARYVGRYATLPSFDLHAMAGGGFPGMLDGGSTAVTVEVYDVDAATLARLDQLESNGRFYQRRRIALRPTNGEGRGTVAWTYILLPGHRVGSHIPSGDWAEYKAATGRDW